MADRLEHLRNCPIFQGVSSDYIENLVAKGAINKVTVPPNKIIFYQDDPGEGMYVILKGSVEIKIEQNHHSVVIGNLSAGAFFGEISMLIEHTRTATIKTLEECELYYYERNVFKRAIHQKDVDALQISYNICEKLAEKLVANNKLLLEKANKKPLEREISSVKNLLASNLLL